LRTVILGIFSSHRPDVFRWDTEKAAPEITVSKEGLFITRTSTKGQNPCALASQPLTKKAPHFRVEVKKVTIVTITLF
jgi:hypothetical protein